MAKRLGKTASLGELDELDRLLSVNPSYSYLAEVVMSLKGNSEHVEKSMPEAELASNGWAHLAERMNNATGGRRKAGVIRLMRWKWAAAAVVFVTTGWGVYRWSSEPAQSTMYGSTQVEYGKKTMLVLEDGTQVWLNAGSRLLYPKTFSGKTREVQLEGEAFLT
ncbi:hypothetical protein ACQ86N_05040 [Puia sp. P3]|uniref:hypothetical protein n=1 Tax=Puia sp. P3 TaxID=3423952 RepID=UPI003D66494E